MKVVPKGWMVVACHGEAHSNANVDGCCICAPMWGERLVRADGVPATRREHARAVGRYRNSETES